MANLRGWPDNYKVSTGIRNGGHKKRKYNLLIMFKTKPFRIYLPRLSVLGYGDVGHDGAGISSLSCMKLKWPSTRGLCNCIESIEPIARDNESILEGFTAFLSAIEYVDRESTSRYARQILARYPHVYALEVALIRNGMI